MNNKVCLPGARDSARQEPSSPYSQFVTKAIWGTAGLVILVVGCALLITVLFLTTHKIRLSQTGKEFLATSIYAAMIAPPSALVLTWVAHRYTDKYPRLVFVFLAVAQAATATAGCLVAGFMLELARIIPRSAYWTEFNSSFPFAILISLMIGLTMSTYETLRYKLQAAKLELSTRQVEQERAYKLMAEAQLSSLESRIHPHFLFNTLNSIAALIPSDPVRAEDTVGKLASLLRFSLNANQSGLVPLSQELKIVRDYLEIEKTRFGARLRYDMGVPDSLASVKVPPLALQSLVENCVKHVVSKRTEGARIQVTGTIESDRLHLEVVDDGPGFTLDAISSDHGLGNLIARLELLFGPAGRLEVSRRDEKTAVRLSFPA
ncbi:MAG: histidine kinase [Terracidiphilus sp.]|jgi:signal transduction histidine kinase